MGRSRGLSSVFRAGRALPIHETCEARVTRVSRPLHYVLPGRECDLHRVKGTPMIVANCWARLLAGAGWPQAWSTPAARTPMRAWARAWLARATGHRIAPARDGADAVSGSNSLVGNRRPTILVSRAWWGFSCTRTLCRRRTLALAHKRAFDERGWVSVAQASLRVSKRCAGRAVKRGELDGPPGETAHEPR